MREIKLTQGKTAIVDDADYEMLRTKTWAAQKGKSTFYVVRSTSRASGKKTIYLHWEVVGKAPAGMEIDHINGNGLDNRRENLRFVTRRQNLQNRKNYKATSKLPGVSWHKRTRKWQARAYIGESEKYLGIFSTEQEAFAAYQRAVEKTGAVMLRNEN